MTNSTSFFSVLFPSASWSASCYRWRPGTARSWTHWSRRRGVSTRWWGGRAASSGSWRRSWTGPRATARPCRGSSRRWWTRSTTWSTSAPKIEVRDLEVKVWKAWEVRRKLRMRSHAIAVKRAHVLVDEDGGEERLDPWEVSEQWWTKWRSLIKKISHWETLEPSSWWRNTKNGLRWGRYSFLFFFTEWKTRNQ